MAAKLAQRYIVPFLSKQDGLMCGEELKKIALANNVNNIEHLDSEMVFSVVEKDPKHRMRKIYDWNDRRAARKHRLEFTRKLISGVRAITVNLEKKRVYEPMFISAQAPVRQQGSQSLQRTHVFRPDMLAHDPIFLSALSSKLRRLVGVLQEIEHLADSRTVPPEVRTLLKDVRAAVDNCSFTADL